MKKNLVWINPLSHPVYQGWLYFLNKFYKLKMFDEAYSHVTFGNHQKILPQYSYRNKSNFFYFYRKPKILDQDIKIVGDIFTNNLCYSIRKNAIYYTEFFANGTNKKKSLIAKLIVKLFFNNKKIIVPTKQSVEFFKNNPNITYFPPIYYGNIYKNKSLSDNTLRILFVGYIDDWKKNVPFMLNCLKSIKNSNIKITLVGRNDKLNLREYRNFFKDKLEIIPQLKHDDLFEIYSQNNLFVLPSLADPIGAVLLEAMSCEMPILVSDAVGAASFIVNNKNGVIFKSNNETDFLEKVKKFFNKETRIKMGLESHKILTNEYWYKNKKVLLNRRKTLEKIFE